MRDSGSGPSSPFHRTLRFPSQLAALPLSSYYLERGAAGHLAPFSLPFSLSLSLSLSPRSLVPRVLTDGFEWFRMVVWAVWDGVHLILGTVRNAPTHRNKPESRRITGDVVRVIYIGGTYAWPGFVCPSVRPSVRPPAVSRMHSLGVLSLQMTVPIIEY